MDSSHQRTGVPRPMRNTLPVEHEDEHEHEDELEGPA
jgi:hypothetical protein